MNKFSLVMAFVFIVCALGIHPASAQQVEYGYVPLLTEGYDTSLPRQMVSRLSFERMLPRLMEAKAAGYIADFEPDFYGGFVRVSNPSTSLRSGSGTFALKTDMWDAIVRPPVTEDQGNIRSADVFHTYFYNFSSCFDIYNAGDGSRVVGTLSTPAGEIVGYSDGTANSSGTLYDCFSGISTGTTPGYKISLKVFNSGGTWLKTYTTNVPRNTFKTYAKSTGVVTGAAPAGLPYTAYWSHNNQDAGETYTSQGIDGTVPSDGKWTADFAYAFKGGDWIDIYLDKTANFTFDYYFQISRLGCGLNYYYCFLTGIPNKPIEVTVIHGGKTYKFSGMTSRTGYYYAYLYDTLGDPVRLSVGDKVTGTGADVHTLPNLTMLVNRTGNTISGKAPASKYFPVIFINMETNYGYWEWAHSNAAGAYTADFTWTDIPAKGGIYSEIQITIPSTGNFTWLGKVTP